MSTLLTFLVVGMASAAHPQTAKADSIFGATCGYSHTSKDDPIVHPGKPGAGHSHDFTGAWSTNAYSTPESLLRSGTSCVPSADKSAYWTPTLFEDGKPVVPEVATAYISEGNKGRSRQELQAWPPGLKVIADVNGYPHEGEGSGFYCGSQFRDQGIVLGPNVQACPDGYKVISVMIFPDCWDGKNLDSPDHRSHMSYLSVTDGYCPPSHPVLVPQLAFKTVYETQGKGDEYTVAGGVGGEDAPTSSYHADFINAWDQAELERRLQYCVKEQRAAPRDKIW